MTEPDAPPPGRWQSATVVRVTKETERAKTFRLMLPEVSRHLAGQHYVVRLTAADGYSASRSYSVASPPDESAYIELTVERLEDGEVSSYMHDVVVPGDELEVRGPVGGWFVWRGDTPALLVGGGSGIVPLMAMLRLARRSGRCDLVRLVVSVRCPDELCYAEELPGPETTVVYPGGCLLEGTNLSDGRGTTRPFEITGAPYVDGERLARGDRAEVARGFLGADVAGALAISVHGN